MANEKTAPATQPEPVEYHVATPEESHPELHPAPAPEAVVPAVPTVHPVELEPGPVWAPLGTPQGEVVFEPPKKDS